MVKRWVLSPRKRVLFSLVGLTAASLALYLAGAIANRNMEFLYLPYNLMLAWVPFVLMAVLFRVLHTRRWSNWLPFTLTSLWLLLLPNTFYMISDFVHIQGVGRHNLLFDVVMFSTFIATASLLGFCSLYLVHAQLIRRIGVRDSHILVGAILLLCSFAIYLGRDLRWNSWDVLLNPAGILFDVSDHLIHPTAHGEMFSTTASFFILLGGLYVFGWNVALAMIHGLHHHATPGNTH